MAQEPQDPNHRVSLEEFDRLMALPVRLAEKEAEVMLAKGVDVAIVSRHVTGAAERQAEAKYRLLSAATAAQQPPQAATPPTVQPATPAAPPLAAPGSPPPHIPLVNTPNARLMADFYAARGASAALHQTAGDNRFDLSLPMGLKARR